MHGLLTGVQLLDVKPEVSFPAAGCRTEFTLVDRLVAGVNGPVSLQTVALGEPRVANITFIGLLTWTGKYRLRDKKTELLTSVYPQMSL